MPTDNITYKVIGLENLNDADNVKLIVTETAQPIKKKKSMCKKIFSLTTLFVLFLIMFQFIEIIIGTSVGTTCDKPVVSISMWLVVKGTISFLCGIILLSYTKVAFTIHIIKMIIKGSFFLLLFLEFCWLIIGCFSFWYGCDQISPTSIKHFMWLSIFYGFITVYIKFEIYRRRRNQLNEH